MADVANAPVFRTYGLLGRRQRPALVSGLRYIVQILVRLLLPDIDLSPCSMERSPLLIAKRVLAVAGVGTLLVFSLLVILYGVADMRVFASTTRF
jgi:hypothetical protein